MLQEGIDAFTGNPAFGGTQSAVADLAADPYTLGPEEVARIKADQLGQNQTAFDSNLDRLHERQAANGLYRSGSTRLGEDRLLGGYANEVGRINRDVDIMAAEQRPKDVAGLVSTVMPWLGQLYNFGRDKAQIRAGLSLSPIWQQPSPNAQWTQFGRDWIQTDHESFNKAAGSAKGE